MGLSYDQMREWGDKTPLQKIKTYRRRQSGEVKQAEQDLQASARHYTEEFKKLEEIDAEIWRLEEEEKENNK